jgi:hypothetical protein
MSYQSADIAYSNGQQFEEKKLQSIWKYLVVVSAFGAVGLMAVTFSGYNPILSSMPRTQLAVEGSIKYSTLSSSEQVVLFEDFKKAYGRSVILL